MFWKKKIKCPITSEDKIWIDENLDWIFSNILTIKGHAAILPDVQFFKHEFKQDESDAIYVLHRIGELINIDVSDIYLSFYSEEQIELARGIMTTNESDKGTAGIYLEENGIVEIAIEVQQLKNPESLIATIAHEISHYDLIYQKQIKFEGQENEYFTDLYTIALGFGIFLGNTKFNFNQWQDTDGWGGWSYSSQGYLPLELIAYAMAKIEFLKGRSSIEWKNYLTAELRTLTTKSLKFLLKN